LLRPTFVESGETVTEEKNRFLKKFMAKNKRWIPSDSKSLDDPLNQETLKGVPTNMVSNKIEIWSNDIVVTV